jgi:peptidoglycan/LPS O-acetylase OafA/YrhL
MSKERAARIQDGFSLYLDFWRAAAAFMVLLRHGTKQIFTLGTLPTFPYGHDAVVIFFVLSGFVISNVHRTRETDLRTFSLKRMSRIYSVFIPAVILSVLFDALGFLKNPAIYGEGFSHPWNLRTLAQTLIFLGQNWNQNTGLGTNGALWSLHFEVWYYALFAAFVFSPKRLRYFLVGAMCLFIGPKILILMPCWLAGVAADRLRPPRAFLRFGKPLAALTFLVFIIWFLAKPMSQFEVAGIFRFRLDDARYFLNDIPLAFLMALHLMAVRAAGDSQRAAAEPSARGKMPRALQWPIAQAASTSFTLYLLNLPVLRFLGAMFGVSQTTGLGAIAARTAATFAICFVIGLLVENKKRQLYQFFDRLLPKKRKPESVKAEVYE